jgi:hypothetical protein
MATGGAIGGAFFLVMGVLFVVFRDPLTRYLGAIYPASMLPERGALSWMLVLFGLAFIAIGGSLLLQAP